MFLIFFLMEAEEEKGERGVRGNKAGDDVDVVHGAGFGKTFSSFILAIVMVWTLRARVYKTTTIYSITT
jgi:hypothetical protein